MIESVRKTITSLALLRVTSTYLRRNYIESFVPFIATLIRKKGYETIKTVQVCEDFKKEFGLIIPFYPMVTILNQTKEKGVITYSKQRGEFIPDKDKVTEYDFTDISQQQERKQEKIINQFIAFSKEEYSVDLDKVEAESAFLSYLKQYDLDILFASQERSVLPEVTPSQRNHFLFSSFMRQAYNSEPEVFKFLVDIAMGHVLASILLYDFKVKQTKSKLNNLNLYFDTTFIFRLLGVESEERELVYTEFLKGLNNQGANFFLFKHTYDEIMGILDGCLEWIGRIDYDPSMANPALLYFIEKGYTKDDVQRFILNIDDHLGEHEITIIDSPDPDKHRRYQIGEEKLHDFIVSTYSQSNPAFQPKEKESTIQKDIQSISAINRLRGGRTPVKIKKLKHAFITTNTSLAYANRRFEISEKGDYFYLPACLTDVFLGTLLWLQSPTQFGVVNEKKVIADCYAALQPDEILMKKFVSEVERLKQKGRVSEEDY